MSRALDKNSIKERKFLATNSDFPFSSRQGESKNSSLFCIPDEQQGQEAEYYCTCFSFPKKSSEEAADHKEQEE
jgi:hypothetical protein